MEGCALIFMVLVCILVFVIGIVGGTIAGIFACIGELFQGAGIWGIITVAGIILFVVAIIAIINS
ncbi:MAG: hypothetical protein KBT57_06185 [bacterium]|nr:hypothetical protein [Candidatus Limimorpha equi]